MGGLQVKLISLSGRYGAGMVAIVSDCDFEFLSQWTWNLIPKGYAMRTDRTNGKRSVYMHKVIGERMGVPIGMQTDHKSTNKLDNQRENLRPATNQMNQANVGRQKNNTTGFKGVHWHRQHKKYCARIGVSGKRINLGWFDNAADAHQAYRIAASLYFGEFARCE